MIHSTTTGTDYNPTGTNAEPNYSQSCWYRLPCGICTRTNQVCPVVGMVHVDFNEITCQTEDGSNNASTGFSSKFTYKETDEILNNIFTWRPTKE